MHALFLHVQLICAHHASIFHHVLHVMCNVMRDDACCACIALYGLHVMVQKWACFLGFLGLSKILKIADFSLFLADFGPFLANFQ